MRSILLLLLALGLSLSSHGQAQTISWDKYSLMVDGHRVCPVMGEVHYSRIPVAEWADEVRKMKVGGVTVIACYMFWNHIEETGGVFDWSGQRNLRQFLEVGRQSGRHMPLIA